MTLIPKRHLASVTIIKPNDQPFLTPFPPTTGCKTCGNIPCMKNTDVIFKDLPDPVRHYIAQLEARVAKLEQQLTQVQESVIQKDKQIATLQKDNGRLKFQNAKLIHDKYGQSSEKSGNLVSMDNITIGVVGDKEGQDNENNELTDEDIKQALDLYGDRENTKDKKKRTPNLRKKIPNYLPRIEDKIDIPKTDRQCPCGGLMYKIGDVRSEKVNYTPARLEVIKYIRPKYACRTCYEHVLNIPLPKMPIKNSYAHPTLLAHTIVSKYCDHLPLFRQAEIWKRQGIHDILHRKTMVDWMNACGKLLAPIVDCMKDKIIASGYARADETTVRVVNQDGKSKKSKGYMWLFMTGDKQEPYVLFEYHPTRSGEAANEFFKDFKGTLLVDGFSGYNALRLREDIQVAGCNAHMRRKFVDIIKTSKKSGKALEAINFIQQLYKVEALSKDLSNEERTLFRQQKAKPIWQSFKFWLKATQKTAPPKSALGLAIGYALNHYQYLTHYLSDGRIDICNNWGENQIRPFALGRKNWRMQSSSQGAEASAVLYSLAITCKARGINPFDYFAKALEAAPYCKSRKDWDRLVP